MQAIKYKTKNTGITANPIFIVGMCPGKQRKKNQTRIVWEGNRSGDLMTRIIRGKKNLFLTNAFNYYVDGDVPENIIDEGKFDLLEDIYRYNPRKVLCFGEVARKTIKELDVVKCPIKLFKHPSYILRFNLDKEKYIKEVRGELDDDKSESA